MKVFVIIFMSLFSISTLATENLMSCGTASLASGGDEANPSFESFEIALTVTADAQTSYGFRADYTNENKKVTEPDTSYEVLPFDSKDKDLLELVRFMRPDLNFKNIKTVGYANIGVEANAHDQAGIALWNLFDKKGVSLGKVGLFGWTPGKCD